MKRLLFLLLAAASGAHAAAAPAPAAADEPRAGGRALFHLSLAPGVTIPLGESATLYTLGGGAQLAAELSFSSLPMLFARLGIGYDYSPLQWLRSVSLVTASLGGGVQVDLAPWLAARAFAVGGGYLGFMNQPVELDGGVFPYVAAGAGLSFALGPTFSLGIGGSYENCIGLYQGVRAAVSASYQVGKQPPAVRIRDPRFLDVFSVFHKYYDDHPLGEAVIENREGSPLTDVRATLQIREYMDAPKDCVVAAVVRPGESQRIELYGLFKEKVLEITESTKVSVEITVHYTLKGREYTLPLVQTLRILDRNAMTWDDDRHAAAFVTAKDPQVLSFAKNALAAVSGKMPGAIDRNLVVAMAVHEALALFGMSYSPDPARPYAEMSKNDTAVDSLQFPRHTLDYRAGDCDDLSILACALLESLDVRTAFLTVPGHIFMAFALDMDESEARATLQRPDEVIFRNRRAWIPVEITMTRDGFLDAWQRGAQEWREAEAKGQAGFFDVREAWRAYEPVGVPGSSTPPRLPAEAELLARCQKQLARFVDRELAVRVRQIEAEIASSGGTARVHNKLGVLYARYGVSDKAEAQFQKSIAKEEYVPALVNLGNLAFLRGETTRAIAWFKRASLKSPDDAGVLLGLARAHHQAGDAANADATFARLKTVAPSVAEKYDYLALSGGSSRAGQAGADVGRIPWAED
jgi:tetratricopeptide (TPR) repeat protein